MSFPFLTPPRLYLIWTGILALVAILLAQLPLFNLLGFEFSVVISIIIGLAGAHIAISAVKRIREERVPMIVYDSPTSVVISVFFWVLLTNLSLLMLPLAIILLNAFRVKNCDVAEGFAFFGLIPAITCAYSSVAGLFFGFLFKKRWSAFCAYLAYIFATVLYGLYNIIFHPPVFGYNSVIGYFPGPIYDERVSITNTLIIARVSTLILTFIFLLLSVNLLDELKIKFRRFFQRDFSFNTTLNRVFLAFFVIAHVLIFLFQGDLGLRLSRSTIQKKLGGKYETLHFNIYYEKGSKVEKDIKLIALEHEFRYYQLSKFFMMFPEKKVGSYIYTTPEQKKRLMGARHTAVEDQFGYELHINYNNFPHPMLKHELAHVLCSNFHPILKFSYKVGLHEGIAVAADWDAGKLTVHQWSKAMKQLGVAPPIEKIMGAFGFWTESSSRSYTLAGSFVRFLVDTYGIEKFKKVFPTGNFKKYYRKKLKELVAEWEEFLDTVKLSKNDMAIAEYRFKRPTIFQKTCAHEVAELADKAWDEYSRENYDGAIEIFQNIYRFDKDNPRPLKGLLYCYYYAKDYDTTFQIAEKIIKHKNSGVLFTAMAQNFKGNICWQRDRLSKARKIFNKIYKLHISNNYDRELSAKLKSLEFPEIADKMRDVLISREKDDVRLILLKEILEEHPDFSVAHYLIGRQLHFDKKYAHSNKYLLQAESLGLPNESMMLETYRMLGVNHFLMAEYEQAMDSFDKIVTSNRSQGDINKAREWIEFCEWMLL